MAKWRNPLAEVRTTTVAIVGLTGLWTAFQVFDDNPPSMLDQLLVTAFGIWFASEVKLGNKAKAKKKSSDDEEERSA